MHFGHSSSRSSLHLNSNILIMATTSAKKSFFIDSAAVASYSVPNLPTGSFNLRVAEGRGLAAKDFGGTSDPYVSVAVVDPATLKEIKLKCDPIKKTLNPIWNFNLHSWIPSLPFVVKIEIYDKDLIKDDFMGYYEMRFETEEDLMSDQWVSLTQRPGKKDKGVKGQIHLVWSVSFLKNFNPLDPRNWNDECFVTIEPTPEVARVDVMGPIHDLVLLIAQKDSSVRRLPRKLFSPLHPTESLGWTIKICDPPTQKDKVGFKFSWKQDCLYHVCVHLLEKFTEFGFEIKHGDHLHETPIGGWTYDRALFLVKSRSFINLHPHCSIIAVQSYDKYMGTKLRTEIIGAADPSIHTALSSHFSYDEIKDPSTGSVVLTSFFLSDYKQRFPFIRPDSKRPGVSQSLLMQVMNVLHQQGFLYLTIWGTLHLMVRDKDFHARGIMPPPQQFISVDPHFVYGTQTEAPFIDIQGTAPLEALQHVVSLMSLPDSPPAVEIVAVRDSTNQIMWNRLSSLQKMPFGVPDTEAWVRARNVFQNIFIAVVAHLCDEVSCAPVGAIGKFGILLARHIGAFPSGWRCQSVMLDPGFNDVGPKMRIEIQGNIEFNEINTATMAVGFEKLIEESDSQNSRICWVAPISRTDPTMANKKSVAFDLNKREFHIAKLISFFQNELSFEATAQIGTDSLLFHRVPSGTLPKCGYMFVDTNFVLGQDVALEVCGDIDGQEVAAAAFFAGISQPVPIVDASDMSRVWGYQMKMVAIKVIQGDADVIHRLNTHWKFIWIKFVNKLAEFGWQYKMALNPGNHRIAIFFRPLVMVVTTVTHISAT